MVIPTDYHSISRMYKNIGPNNVFFFVFLEISNLYSLCTISLCGKSNNRI